MYPRRLLYNLTTICSNVSNTDARIHCVYAMLLDVEDPRNELSLSTGKMVHINYPFDYSDTDSCVRTVIQTFPKVTAKWTGLSGMDHIIRYATNVSHHLITIYTQWRRMEPSTAELCRISASMFREISCTLSTSVAGCH